MMKFLFRNSLDPQMMILHGNSLQNKNYKIEQNKLCNASSKL